MWRIGRLIRIKMDIFYVLLYITALSAIYQANGAVISTREPESRDYDMDTRIRLTCSKPCFRTYDPVCGSDGITYGNLCEFSIEQCVAAYKGKYIFVTHVNQCVEYTTPKEQSTQGETSAATLCPPDCPSTYKPVCASDGNTYRNFCHFIRARCIMRFKNEDLRLVRFRACNPACTLKCSDEYIPKCASNGVTYKNPCEFIKATRCEARSSEETVIISHDGPCVDSVRTTQVEPTESEEDCDRFCITVYEPVCGSDEKTYGNLCEFAVGACKARRDGSTISIVNNGECDDGKEVGILEPMDGDDMSGNGEGSGDEKNQVCPTICTREFNPLCASDGKTYNNPCLLRIAVCEATKNGITDLKKVKDGACDAEPKPNECNKACTFDYRPVCGSDGKTYGNQCAFDIAQCNAANLGQTLTKLGDGECVSIVSTQAPDRPDCNKTVCSQQYEPVCGSDGRTYSNQCTLEVAQCEAKRVGSELTKIGDGECVSIASTSTDAPKVVTTTLDPETDSCERVCARNFDPVCASDGKTYGNTCIFAIGVCRAQREGRSLRINYKGHCRA
ncbi:unnamed protein product [Owenia fusiformis]|uniref:Uncharacterized protein n=1 Tax=Owenia fusiformis TaxID=6347 RepID=A0A8J1UJP7_OWEFU|nr:unnamed protein product [Owenia fusiformis]